MSAARVELYADQAGEWRWRLRAANGEIVIPPESHRDATDARRAVDDAHDVLAEALRRQEVHIV